MAASDKDIVISPQRGSTTNDPSIVFTGDGNDPISVNVLDSTTGSLSFEGSAGQLFSISNNLTSGSIFSVNDVSGIPSLDINADGTILLAEFSGDVGIGTDNPTSKLDVNGTVTATTFESTQATGTAPFTVASTTVVSNLNSDLLDGQHGSYYTSYTDTAISNLVDSSPAALDTLNELAAALGDDANFSTTVTNSIATKLPLAGGTMTGNITFSGSQTVDGRDLSIDGAKLDGIESGATADQTKADIDALNINADQLDGQHGSYYLDTSSTGQTKSGNLTINGTLSADNYNFEPYGVVPAHSNSDYGTITYNSTESAIELSSSTDTSIGMAFPAWKVNVNPGNKWQITMQIRASANTTGGGVYIRVYEYDAELPAGKIAVSNDASNSLVQEDTRRNATSPQYENANGSTNWQTLTFEYTPTSTAVWASIVVLNWTGLGTNALYVREPQIKQKLSNFLTDVGIGTDNPDQDLHLYRSGSDSVLHVEAIGADAILDLDNTGNNNFSGINFTRERSTGTGVVGGSIWMPSDTSNNSATLYLQTQTASAEAGVDAALTDNNGVRLKLASYPGGVGTDSAFSVEVGSVERLRVGAAGSVGIGTDNPGAKLDINGSLSTDAYAIWTETPATGTGGSNGGVILKTNPNQSSSDLNESYIYRVRAVVRSTGTDTGATWLVYYKESSSAYEVRLVNRSGTSSNHPRLRIAGQNNNQMQLYTTHQNSYTVRVITERFYTDEPDSTLHAMGSDYHWQRSINDLYYLDGDVGINETSPDTTLHISKSAAQNDTHGILKVESTNANTGSATNASLIAKNRYGWAQFMQWEDKGLRIGSRSITTGGTGDVYITAGADSVAAVIKAGGSVGIGTNNPDAKLQVYQSDSTVYNTTSDQRSEAEIRITNPLETSGTFSSINFYNGGSTGGDISLNAVKDGNYTSHFTIKQRSGGGSTDWRERLRITSDGNIAVNDTGNAGYTSFSPCIALGDSGDSQPALVIRGSATSVGDISFCDNSGTESEDGVSEGLIRYDHNTDHMEFHTADSERLRITSGGVVQIGGDVENAANDIDASNTKLTIKQSAMGLEDGIYIERPSERRGYYARVANSGNAQDALVFGMTHQGTETDHLLALDRDGNVTMKAGSVGIGTDNPAYKLEVNGDVAIASTVSIGTTIDIVPYNDLGALSFEGSAGQLFSVTNNLTSGSIFSVNDVSGIPSIDVDADGTILLAEFSGDVGIGTDNPTSKLDINGTVTAPTFYATVGTFDAGTDTQTDAAIVIEEEGCIYTRDASQYLRTLIEKKSDVIIIGQYNTSLIDNIELRPGGGGGSVKLHAGGSSANVKLETTASGVTVTGSATATTFESTQATGTAPFTVASTTVVSNLNADLLDGLNSGRFLRSDASDTYSGEISGRVLSFRCVDGRNAASSSGSLFPLQVYQDSNVTNSDAAMTFHIAGHYATYFGLDHQTNDLFVGGWSKGATKYKIWHAGNITPLDTSSTAQTKTGNLTLETTGSSDYFRVRHRTDTDNYMDFYCETDTGKIADTFGGNTDKKYIYFNNPNGSNDPGYIMHETRGAENNEGVLHLVPSDDNAEGDYVSIHGTNDPDVLKLHTSGLIETAANYTLNLKSAGGDGVQINGNRVFHDGYHPDADKVKLADSSGGDKKVLLVSNTAAENDYIEPLIGDGENLIFNISTGDLTLGGDLLFTGFNIKTGVTSPTGTGSTNYYNEDITGSFSSVTLIEESADGGMVFKSNGGGGAGAFQFYDAGWRPKFKLRSGSNTGVELFHGESGMVMKTTDGFSGIGVTVFGDLYVGDGNNSLTPPENSGGSGSVFIAGDLTVSSTCSTLKSKTTSFGTGSNADGFSFQTSGVHEIGRNTAAGNSVFKVYGGSGEFRVKGDGDCQNTFNTYTVISDENLKENIVDASSQWDDIKGVRIRNYNLKSSTGYSTHRQIGVIAQEIETVCPGLVKDSNEEDDDGNVTGTIKTVLSSVLYMKAVKALQEAMERIETLEAKVAALESGN